MEKHTAGKWQVDIITIPTVENNWDSEINIIDERGRTLANLTQWDEQKANAQFIVKACNNFEELLETLKLAYTNLGATAISEHTFTHVRSKMKQAIAKATNTP